MLDQTNTDRRVRQLVQLGLLSAPLDPIVQNVCELAASIFAMPITLVSVLDATHKRIIARHGTDAESLPRQDAICEYTIRQTEPLVISDTLDDPRVQSLACVASAPHLRFYAGVPLSVTPGVVLGTLCLLDTQPRQFTPAQVASLQGLAAVVVAQFRQHQAQQDLTRHAIELAHRQAILEQTERFAKVGGFRANLATGRMRWSEELHRLYGIDASESPTLERFLALFQDEDRTKLRLAFEALDREEAEFSLEVTLNAGRGPSRLVRVHAESRMLAEGRRTVGIVQDITEHAAALRKLEWIATHDPLTKLCNRAHFDEQLQGALANAEASGASLTLLSLDIDNFKVINDTYGHDAGDAVLCAIAKRLQAVVGPKGRLARLGGDEFAVLATDADVAALAETIVARMREPLVHDGHDLSARVTIGVAPYAFDGAAPATLFKNADLALYRAKQAGRDRFAFYEPAMRDEVDGLGNRRRRNRPGLGERAPRKLRLAVANA